MSTQSNLTNPTCDYLTFEDHINIISKKFKIEKDLKNNAFSFLVDKGLYSEFHEWLQSGDKKDADTLEDR